MEDIIKERENHISSNKLLQFKKTVDKYLNNKESDSNHDTRLRKYLGKEKKKLLINVVRIYREREDLTEFRLMIVNSILSHFNRKLSEIKFCATNNIDAKLTILEYKIE